MNGAADVMPTNAGTSYCAQNGSGEQLPVLAHEGNERFSHMGIELAADTVTDHVKRR